MSEQLFTLPRVIVFDTNAALVSGAKANFYIAGTLNRQNTYTDSALTTPHANPVVADGNGVFAPIYLDATLNYKVDITDSLDSSLADYPVDNITASLTATEVGTALWPTTTEETSAGVTPTNFAYESGNVKRYGAVGDEITDDTAAIQVALDFAFAGARGSIFIPDGTYIIYGTLTIPAGVTLYGTASSSEYFPGQAASAIDGAELLKPLSGSTAGPIIQMTTAAGLRGVYLKHLLTNGATTGIIQMGATGTTVACYNAKVTDVRMYGDLTTDVTGTNTCYGIFFPRSISTAQRFFNKFNDIYITNCDVAIHLDESSNGNNFTSMVTRQCYTHYELDGNSNNDCTGNTFTGLVIANIGVLPTTQPKCFVLKNTAQWNTFLGYQTEINGQAFDIDSTSVLNMFQGQENEVDPSAVPVGGVTGPALTNAHAKYQRPINVEQYSQTLLPSLSTGQIFDQIVGSKFHSYQLVDGTANGLPALNDGVGTLVAADADSRIIIQFKDTAYKKNAEPNFRCVLTVFVTQTSGAQTMATVDFSYVTTNPATDAGLISVHSVQLTPAASNYISGLWFIDGATGSTEFRIGMVGGNVSATVASKVAVSLDVTHYKLSEIATNDYVNNGFISTAATANDVTDAIDLLTVAETVV